MALRAPADSRNGADAGHAELRDLLTGPDAAAQSVADDRQAQPCDGAEDAGQGEGEPRLRPAPGEGARRWSEDACVDEGEGLLLDGGRVAPQGRLIALAIGLRRCLQLL
jgi:hypothetical protein